MKKIKKFNTVSSSGILNPTSNRLPTEVNGNTIVENMPTIEELISNLNYNQSIQPFDFGMDRDLEVIVDQLKRQKKSNFLELKLRRY